MEDSNDESSRGGKVALLIGNNDYTQSANKLTDSIENTNKLKRLLEKANFKVTQANNLSENDLSTTIATFAQTTIDDRNALVLFYYSGHACHVNGENYVIPIDDDKTEKFGDIPLLSFKFSGIIDRLIDNESSDATIFIFDCPRPYTPKKGLASASKNEGTGLILIKPPNGALIQFACDEKQTMKNAPETIGYDLYTKHLLKNISKKDTDIIKVFKRISDGVYEESNRRQRPLTMNELHHEPPICLNEATDLIPQIPYSATWNNAGSTVIGGRGSGSTLDRLNTPKGLRVKNNESLLIADTKSHRVLSHRPSTGKTRVVAGTGGPRDLSEQLCRPTDVIFDKNLESDIISDTNNHRVLYLRPKTAGNHTRESKQILGSGVAMDKEGALYVCDQRGDAVIRYAANTRVGTVVAGGYGQGSRLRQLNHPTFVAVGRDQSVYVSDSHNNRVMKWIKGAKKGIIVAGGHGKGNGKDQLDYPTGIVVDQSDTIYVADYWNHRVMRWRKGASHGEIIAGNAFLPGNNKKHLNGPEGLAFDEDGNLYVADSNNHRIQRFNIS